MDWKSEYKRERKANWEEIAEAIHQAVTMDDVIALYVPGASPRQHRIPCPIHNGKDYNFSFTEKGFKCFVCGESGDVVKFVEKMLDISRTNAMRRINENLNLNLPIDRIATVTESHALDERIKVAREREYARQLYQQEYDDLMDEWCKLDKIKRTDDPNSDEYADAVRRMPYIEYRIDTLKEPG